MADDAAPTGTPSQSPPPRPRHPILPSQADGHRSPRPAGNPLADADRDIDADAYNGDPDHLPEHWPVATSVYTFFYVWASEIGECCGPGTESLQGALDDDRVQLLCLACDTLRTVPSHQAEVII